MLRLSLSPLLFCLFFTFSRSPPFFNIVFSPLLLCFKYFQADHFFFFFFIPHFIFTQNSDIWQYIYFYSIPVDAIGSQYGRWSMLFFSAFRLLWLQLRIFNNLKMVWRCFLVTQKILKFPSCFLLKILKTFFKIFKKNLFCWKSFKNKIFVVRQHLKRRYNRICEVTWFISPFYFLFLKTAKSHHSWPK